MFCALMYSWCQRLAVTRHFLMGVLHLHAPKVLSDFRFTCPRDDLLLLVIPILSYFSFTPSFGGCLFLMRSANGSPMVNDFF